MHLRLERAASELPADCEAVFRNSAIFERYFQDPGRLELSLRRAAAQGELYLAVSEDGELAGARRVTLMVSDFNQGAQAFYRCGKARDRRAGYGQGPAVIEPIFRRTRPGGQCHYKISTCPQKT